jgi:hypothetical protein
MVTLPTDILSSPSRLEETTASRKLARRHRRRKQYQRTWKPTLQPINEDSEIAQLIASRNTKRNTPSTSHYDVPQGHVTSRRIIFPDYWSRSSQPQPRYTRPRLQSQKSSLKRKISIRNDLNTWFSQPSTTTSPLKNQKSSLKRMNSMGIASNTWFSQPHSTRSPFQSQKSSPNRMIKMEIASKTRVAASPRTFFPDYWSRVSQSQRYTIQS